MSLILEQRWPIAANHMQTATGRHINPVSLSPDDICIEDIAIALGNICRYNGHCLFMSVAEHCINVSKWVRNNGGSLKQQLAGLLHDAHEAYLGDVIRPIKHNTSNIDGETFALIVNDREQLADIAIATHFGLHWSDLRDPIVKAGDEAVLEVELRHRAGKMTPRDAARWYLNRYQLLRLNMRKQETGEGDGRDA